MPSHRARRWTVLCATAATFAALVTACSSTVHGNGSSSTSSGATPAPTTSAGTPNISVPLISFTDCKSLLNLSGSGIPTQRLAHLSFDCGQLAVPLDYRDPTGQKIEIQLIKVHDDSNQSGNDLLVNPGGPGGSGVDLAVGMAGEVTDTLLAHFDIVGFDPRGVGLSTPAISCISDTQKDALNAAFPDVLTAAGFTEAKNLAASVAQACSTKYAGSLADFDTVQTAEDMDLIREGLGESQLNYLGFSYGTELGSVYAHLFPHNVRVEVLDGAVDPLTSSITQFAEQLGGFEAAFNQFAAACASQPYCTGLSNPRQVVYNLVARANQNPIPTSNPSDTRKATGALVLTGVLSALYSESEWPQLAAALVSAENGDSKGLLALADQYNERNSDGTYTNIYDANTTIECNDSRPGPSDATVRATATQWATQYPMFGLWSAASLFSCQDWQPDRTPIPLASAPGTPQTVLVIGNLHDPATPYQGAIDMTKILGHAELLTWNGEGHTSYLQGSTCIDTYVNNYLINSTLPPLNTTCPA